MPGNPSEKPLKRTPREEVPPSRHLELQDLIGRQLGVARSHSKNHPDVHVDAIGAAMQSVREMNAVHPSEPTALDIDLTPTEKEAQIAIDKEWTRLSYERDAAFEACKKFLVSGTDDEKRSSAQRLSDASIQLSDFEQKHGLQTTSDE